jgi:hypothetical protein
MSSVILIEEIKENLFCTNLKLSTPQKSINIDARDLLNDEIVEAWGTDGARVSFSLNISKKINEFIDRFTVARRNIISPLMFDGHQFLIYESQLNQFLVACKEMDEQFADELEAITGEWDSIQEEFESLLIEKMRVAIAKSKLNENKTADDIDVEVLEAVNQYMTRKFPTSEQVIDKSGVIYETPRLFKQAIPATLSKEAKEAYEKSQTENMKLIFDLLVKDYEKLEIDFTVGFLDELQDAVKKSELPFTPISDRIKEIVNGLITLKSSDDDFSLASSDDNNDTHIDIRSSLENLRTDDGTRKFNITSYKRLKIDLGNLKVNVSNSIPLLKSVIDSDKLSTLETIDNNIDIFSERCDNYIVTHKTKPAPKKKEKLVVIEDSNNLNMGTDEKVIVEDSDIDNDIKLVEDNIEEIKEEKIEISLDDDEDINIF